MKRILLLLSILALAEIHPGIAQPFNRYARLDGIDDGFTSNLIIPEGSFTIECYFRYCKDLPYNPRVLFSTDAISFGIEKDTDTYYYTMNDAWFLQVANYQGNVTLEGQRLASDQWTHFAVVYNDTFQTVTHFIDGYAHEANYDLNTTLSIQDALTVGLPGYLLLFPFKGDIDEMRISSGVRYNTNATFTPPTSPFTPDSTTIALWHFDEPDYFPSTITDASGNGYSLTAQNGVNIIHDYDSSIAGLTSVTTYSPYAYSLPGLPFYFTASWHVNNGTITYNSNDSILVMWDSIGAGSVSVNVVDTVTDCVISASQILTTVAGCAANFYLYPDILTPHHYYGLNLASGLSPLSYNWNWGDGSFDTIAYPSHTYSSAGFYNICLSIQDSAGCISSVCLDYQLQKLSSAEEENTMVTVDVVADIPTAIRNENVLQSWSLFPNPASGNSLINYTLLVQTKVNIDLYGILGNHIEQLAEDDEQAGEHNIRVDLSKFSNGVYVLKIRAGNQIASQKIAVMN